MFWTISGASSASGIRRFTYNLARMEEAHIAFWEDRLRSAGERVGPRVEEILRPVV